MKQQNNGPLLNFKWFFLVVPYQLHWKKLTEWFYGFHVVAALLVNTLHCNFIPTWVSASCYIYIASQCSTYITTDHRKSTESCVSVKNYYIHKFVQIPVWNNKYTATRCTFLNVATPHIALEDTAYVTVNLSLCLQSWSFLRPISIFLSLV